MSIKLNNQTIAAVGQMTPVEDTLDSISTSSALSANQGRVLNDYIDNGKEILIKSLQLGQWQKICHYDFVGRFISAQLNITINNGGYSPGLLEFYVSVYSQGDPELYKPVVGAYAVVKKGSFNVDNNVAVVDEGWNGEYRRVGVYVKQSSKYSLIVTTQRHIIAFQPTSDIVDNLPSGDVTYINM